MAKFRRNHEPTNQFNNKLIIFIVLFLFLGAAMIYLYQLIV